MRISKNHAILGFIFLLFAAVTIPGLQEIRPADEIVYYYMGFALSEGLIPYKEYFLAHPPLQIGIFALFFSLGLSSFIFLKSIAWVSVLGTGVFLYLIATRRYSSFAGYVALVSYLFTYGALFNSVLGWGINLSVFFLVAGYYAYSKKKFVLAGALFACAGLTRLLALIPIAVILGWMMIKQRQSLLNTLKGFLPVFVVPQFLMLLIVGGAYLSQVYGFHLLKVPIEGLKGAEFVTVLAFNALLFLGLLLHILTFRKRSLTLPFAIALVYLLFLAVSQTIFGHYFLVLFPFLSLVLAQVVDQWKSNLKGWKQYSALGSVGFIFIVGAIASIVFLNTVGYQGLTRLDDLTETLDRHDPTIQVFGDDSITSLLALETQRTIALNSIDTNEQTFLSGLQNLENILEQLQQQESIIILRSLQGISQFEETVTHVNTHCQLQRVIHEELEGDFLFYYCPKVK